MLEARHPVAKLVAAVVLVLGLSAAQSVAATLGMAGVLLVLLVVVERRPVRRIARRIAPFLFLAAAMSWIYLVADNPAHRAVDGAGPWTAALVASRILAMGLVSLAFAETTRADDLARGLEQTARLPRRHVQGVLAAIQALPALADDYRMLRLMQRQAVGAQGWRARWRATQSGLSPDLLLLLLAAAIRRAGAAALSMQIRGLTAQAAGSDWRRRDPGPADVAVVAVAVILAAAVVLRP